MIQTPFTKPTRYVRCPSCGKGEHAVDHLLAEPGRTFGPWHCDECGMAFTGEVISETVVKTETTDQKIFDTEAHLVLEDPRLLPLTFIVRGRAVGQDVEAVIEAEDEHYFYEMHSCPTNFLQEVEKVIAANGDDDPHGLFRWEKTVPASVDAEVVAPPALGPRTA